MTYILLANKITFTVHGREMPILHETTLGINSGEFIVVLGHNGSGKSSLVQILSGERAPSSGEVLLSGGPLNKTNRSVIAQDIVTLAQKAEERLFIDLTLEENVILWESRFNERERLGFDKIMKLTHSPKRFLPRAQELVRNFSGGEKQLILLGLALAHPPKVLFLDEHTASLDPKASNEIMKATNNAILRHQITAIMVTHRLEDALKYGTRLIVMNEGKIVIDQLKSDNLSKQHLQDMME